MKSRSIAWCGGAILSATVSAASAQCVGSTIEMHHRRMGVYLDSASLVQLAQPGFSDGRR